MMDLRTSTLAAALLPVALLATGSTAHAQEAAPTPSPPASSAAQTKMDHEYDGRLHVLLAPYGWLPTVTQNLQYTLPTLPTLRHGVPITMQTSVSVGPSSYLSKVNGAAMFAADAREGDASFYGDYIYTNVSTSSSFTTTISGRRGKISIPATINTSSRLAASIWELNAGLSLAHGHAADVNAFAGIREFPIDLTLSYSAVIGKRGILAPSGSFSLRPIATDAIFGLRGKAFFGNDHWVVPYYFDYGIGANEQSWQGYTGAGYVFDHGQSLLLLYRSLDYNSFTASSPVQKMALNGPLLGYTFNL
jgi:hypothetical protein